MEYDLVEFLLKKYKQKPEKTSELFEYIYSTLNTLHEKRGYLFAEDVVTRKFVKRSAIAKQAKTKTKKKKNLAQIGSVLNIKKDKNFQES